MFDVETKIKTRNCRLEETKAVDATMLLPREIRRLSTLLSRISDPELKIRLAKWCGGGQYAWAVDSPINTFNPMNFKKVGFDTTVILEKTNYDKGKVFNLIMD